MNKLDQAVDGYLRDIGASCPRLLFALHESPEAVWGEIMRMESAYYAFEKACSGLEDKSAAAREIMTLVRALRVHMAKGLIDYEEFAAFRQGVSAIQRCANRLRDSFGEAGPGSNRRLKICAFYCSNNLDAGRLADLGEDVGGATVKTIGLPCSGKVDVPYLLKALETGADGVVIVACKKKECRHLEGSLRAHKRAEAVESLLEEIGLGAGRMAVIECAKDGAGLVCGEITQFVEQIRSLPPERTPGDATNKQECKVA
jgi:coenzyme F420-reducing hydrogenase delta subunit